MIKFVKNTINEYNLNLLISRCIFYNKSLFKYTQSWKGKIPVPEKNLKKIANKYSTVSEYIQSNKKWQKLLEFDEIHFSFESYIDIMIKNWLNIRSLLNNTNLSVTPMFNVILSPKLNSLYWKFVEKDNIKANQTIKRTIINYDSDTLVPTIDSDINSFIFYNNKYPNMSIDDILLTFRRDFSVEFLKVIEKYKENNYNKNDIINYLEKLNKKG